MARILIVDDHAINRRFLATVLGRQHHDVAEAADGRQALAMATAERPDLVIADIFMPAMDGIELVRRLRADPNLTNVPTIFYTAAFRHGEVGKMAADCAGTPVLTKPSTPQAILEAVAQALGAARPAGPRGEALAKTVLPGMLDNTGSPSLSRLKHQLRTAYPPSQPGGDNALQAIGIRLATLLELDLALAREQDPASLLQMACRAAKDILNVHEAAICVVDAAGRLLKLETAGRFAGAQAALGTFQAGPAFLAAFHPPVDAALTSELLSSDRLHGWLYVAGPLAGEPFSIEDELIAATLAAQLTLRWENLALVCEVQRGLRLIQERERRLNGLIESAMDAIVGVNQAQRIVLFNSAAEEMFRRRRDDILGQSLDCLLPERFRAAHRRHIAQFEQSGASNRLMGEPLQVTGLRADGAEFPIEATISQVREGESVFFTAILRDITERKRAAAEIQALARGNLAIQEEERLLLARELHDQIGQALTALKFPFEARRKDGRRRHDPAALDQAVAAIDDLIDKVRTLVRQLRPPPLDDLGIAAAIRDLIAMPSFRGGPAIELDENLGNERLAPSIELNVFRIVQEALTNVWRHSRAQRVVIDLSRRHGSLSLSVRDNGVGFDAPAVMAATGRAMSLGLLGMRERAASLGGTLSIHSSPGLGTEILVDLHLSSMS